MSFVSNGGKFKLYTVLNGLIFPVPTQLRISFERAISINIVYTGCSFKFLLKVRVEESIVNAPRVTDPDQLFKVNLTFCVVYVFILQTDEWCVHNRLTTCMVYYASDLGQKIRIRKI
jgi:hypothetical protein